MLLMKNFLEDKKEMGEDAFWTVAVPSSCRWASDI